MKLYFTGRSDIGARDNQEDRYYIPHSYSNQDFEDGKVFLSIVADGIGGHAHGEVASQLAVTTFKDYFDSALRDNDVSISQVLEDSINHANSHVVAEAKKLGQLGTMGTTLCVIAIKNDKLYWLNTGDSRIYRLRDGQLLQLSRDFNFGEDVKERSLQDPDIKMINESHPEYESLTSFIGMDVDFRHAMDVINFQVDDYYLMCTDGFYGSADSTVVLNAKNDNIHHMLSDVFDTHILPNMDEDQDNTTAVLVYASPENTDNSRNKTVITTELAYPLQKPEFNVVEALGAIFIGFIVGAMAMFLCFELSLFA